MNPEKIIQEFNSKKNRYLLISIVLDLLGMATYLLPMLGEVGDMVFAPIYGIAIFIMYRAKAIAATIGGLGGMIEELLPATDFIPSATLMWVYTFMITKTKTLKQFTQERNKELAEVNQQLDSSK